MKKPGLLILAVLVALLLCAVVCLFVQGSLEQYPTPEQLEKGRILWGVVFGFLAAAEAVVVSRLFRKW